MKRKVRVYRDREIQMTEENRGLWGEGGGERKRGTERVIRMIRKNQGSWREIKGNKDGKEKSWLMER